VVTRRRPIGRRRCSSEREDLNSRLPVPQIAVAVITCCSRTRNVLQDIPKLPEVPQRLQNIAF
jgi:hypothetical protein